MLGTGQADIALAHAEDPARLSQNDGIATRRCLR